MNLGYPGCDRFNSDNFGSCPISLIEQALVALRRNEYRLADLQAMPVAMVGSFYARVHGSKESSAAWFNPFPRMLDDSNTGQILPVVARTFADLSREGKLPHWIQDVVDVQPILSAGRTDDED